MLAAQYSALEYTNTNERLFYSRKCQAAQCSTRLMNILYGVAMLKDSLTDKPYRTVFIVTNTRNRMASNNINALLDWLDLRIGAYGDQWTYKSVYGQFKIIGVLLFAKESHQTLFQLSWSDAFDKFYNSVEECFDDAIS